MMPTSSSASRNSSPPSRTPALIFAAVLTAAVLAGCGGSGGPEWAGPPLVVEGPPFVELERLDGPAPLAGDRVMGQAGDWLLRNERLAVVVSGVVEPPRNPVPGMLIDAAPVGGRDLLESLNPCAIVEPGETPLFREVFHDASADTAGRTLVARGRAGEHHDLMVETRISLEAGSSALRLFSTVTNLGDETRRVRTWGDGVRWGEAEPFVPGLPVNAPVSSTDIRGSSLDAPGASADGDPEARTAPFVTAAGEGAAYAWVAPNTRVAVEDGGITLRSAEPGISLAPGERASFERFFLVGPGTWADAADRAWVMRGEDPARVLVEAVDPQGAPVAGALAEARDESGRVWGRGLTPVSGMTALPVPSGRYDLLITHPQRRARDAKRVTLDAGRLKRETCRLTNPGRLRLSAFDERGKALAARWVLIDQEPERGRRSVADGAAPATHILFSSPASREVLLPPGRYQARASHGPGYETRSGEVTVAADRPHVHRATLESLPIPDGWLAAELSGRPGSAGPVTEAELEALAADGFDLALGPPSGGELPAAGGGVVLIPADAFTYAGAELLRVPLAGSPDEFEAAWNDWNERLGDGAKVVAVAGEPGDIRSEARSYVDTGSRAASTEAIVGAVAEGRVVVTSGPFIRLTLAGVEPGSTLETERGLVRGRLEVIAPRRVDVKEIALHVNGQPHAVYRVRGQADAVRFAEEIELYLAEPSFVVARVDGVTSADAEFSTADPHFPETKTQPLRPLAFTNPIRVEISGDPR